MPQVIFHIFWLNVCEGNHCAENRFLKNYCLGEMSNFPLPGGWSQEPGGEFWLGGMSKNVYIQFLNSQTHYLGIWTP